ncbi:MAG: tyrosine-type recombinase/integrase [Burkholderiales bacterium]
MGAKAEATTNRPITTLELKALRPADDGRKLRLGDGLVGTVRAGHDCVSVHVAWRYRIVGKTREIRLGTWTAKGSITLKALRDERDRLAADLRHGIDPIERRAADRLADEVERAEQARHDRQRIDAARAAELAQQRRLTVPALFDTWRQADLQPRLRADGKRMGRKDGGQYVAEQFERHVFPKIGDMAAEDVRKADLLALLDAQKVQGKMRTANVLLADLKQMLDFAVERELITMNPLASVKKSKVGGPSVERDRILSDDEIRSLARNLETARLGPRTEAAIWLTLATAVRAGELTGAIWSGAPNLARLQSIAEADKVKLGVMDVQARTWHLLDTKNQREHTIHLSDFALRQIVVLAQYREVHADSTDLSPWLFPATDNARPVCVKSFGKQLSDRQRSAEERMSNRTKAVASLALPGGRWTAHDLRRTAASVMARLGFPDSTIHECLNHVQDDRMSRVYIRDRRQTDQRRAFDALGKHLEQLTISECTSSKVMTLLKAA